jgi:hypothetical protein
VKVCKRGKALGHKFLTRRVIASNLLTEAAAVEIPDLTALSATVALSAHDSGLSGSKMFLYAGLLQQIV